MKPWRREKKSKRIRSLTLQITEMKMAGKITMTITTMEVMIQKMMEVMMMMIQMTMKI
ncbi:MAG: hypothetical protein LBT40_16005 [Deltaproteobacteria bacterium]|nr:hypothetical protein [Deltaproteobacteria bacterium]